MIGITHMYDSVLGSAEIVPKPITVDVGDALLTLSAGSAAIMIPTHSIAAGTLSVILLTIFELVDRGVVDVRGVSG